MNSRAGSHLGHSCPSSDQLFAFNVGNLPADLQKSIADHLSDCDRCLAILEGHTDSGDLLLVDLRRPLPPGVPMSAPVRGQLAPSQESRYECKRVHRRGSLGEVWIAHDRELGREVALKRMQPEVAGDERSRRRFLREVEITAKLQHPGVVPVYGLVQDAAREPCCALRLVVGETLRDAIARFHEADTPARDAGERSLALRGLLTRFVMACHTVAYAHSRGIIHRNLKPANIMLGKPGETLVLDWGLARPAAVKACNPSGEEFLALTAESSGADTQLGQVIGTPAYMSPEQAAGAEVGPAGDLYSLGATLYTLLTGQPPFKGPSAEVLASVKTGDFPSPRRIKPAMPRALEAICNKAMARQPADRYRTALELAADVEQWLAGEPVVAYSEPWPACLRRWSKRHRTVVTGLAAAALVVLLLGGGELWMERDRQQRREVADAGSYRYNAACTVALAGCGRGNDADKLDADARTQWRQAARDWLRADLALWEQVLQRGTPQEQARAHQMLQHWLHDADFADVRAATALAKLPAGEQQAWRQLWADVDRLLVVAKGKD